MRVISIVTLVCSAYFFGGCSIIYKDKSEEIIQFDLSFFPSSDMIVVDRIFDLNGSDVYLKEGTIVSFKPYGAIINGIVVGNKSIIRGLHKDAIGVKLAGTWKDINIIEDTFFSNHYLDDNAILENINVLQSDNYHQKVSITRDYCAKINESVGSLLNICSNTELVMTSKISLLPNNMKAYSIINVCAKSDVCITGGYIIGDVGEHKYVNGSTSEWGVGINVISSRNVQIVGTKITKCTGDGIYIGGGSEEYIGEFSKACKNITIKKVECNDNRRQGMSVIHVDGLVVKKSSFINTGQTEKTAPSAGIDLEPNVSNGRNNSIRNVNIAKCVMLGNMGRSFECDLGVTDGIITNYEKVKISDCICDGQFFVGVPNITVRNCQMESVLLRTYEAPVDVFFENCSIGEGGVQIKSPHEHNALYESINGKPIKFARFKNCSVIDENMSTYTKRQINIDDLSYQGHVNDIGNFFIE